MEHALIAEWTLVSEIPIPGDISDLLTEGESAHSAYSTFLDSAIFTNKRLILRDAQGLTGKKIEMYSVPYSAVHMWSTENAGKFLDFTAEVELWTRSGTIKLHLQKGIDVRKIDRLIAERVLNQ